MALEVSGLGVSYGGAVALDDVSLIVESGECLAVVGSNGAGKSTLLGAVAGLTEVQTGSVILSGEDLTGEAAFRRARRGIALVPEEKRLFPTMTVRDTLAISEGRGRPGPWDIAAILDAFPPLKARLKSLSGNLSGGERQMLALARALLLNPKALLLDEPSAGLAPKIFDEVLSAVRSFVHGGLAVILAEQNVSGARKVADRALVLQYGRVSASGGSELLGSESLVRAYLGPT